MRESFPPLGLLRVLRPVPPALGRQRTCPPPDRLSGGRATGGWFPRSPLDHSFREVPSYIPVASPRLRRRLSPWPPARPLQPGVGVGHPPPVDGEWPRATDRPVSTRFEPARRLRDFHHWFTCVAPSDLAWRTRIVWSCRHVPPLSGLLPTLHRRSPGRAAPSFSKPLRRPAGGVLSPPHGQVEPRGARSARRTRQAPGAGVAHRRSASGR